MNDFYRLTAADQGERLSAMAHIALHQWGLVDAEIAILKMRENAVFRVLTSDNRMLVLRIHRYRYHTDAELHSELSWLQALEHHGIHVPAVLPSNSGELFVKVAHPLVPEPRQVDLFAWIDGRQIGTSEHGLSTGLDVPDTFHAAGVLMARMHNQASAWNLPTGFTRHAWDTDGLVGELPFWGRFWELDSLTRVERELILRGRNRVRTELSALDRGHDSYSMIHADFTPENLLMDNLGLRPIDFDDAGFGWHLFDLATALFFHQEETYYSAAQEAMISGYRTRRSLPEAVLSHLPLFMVARSFTYLGWLHTRQETQTAKDMAPLVTDICCHLTRHYLGEPKNSN